MTDHPNYPSRPLQTTRWHGSAQVLAFLLGSSLLTLGSCAVEPEGTSGRECDDGIDNDNNGAIDCDDPRCWPAPVCLPSADDDDAGDDDSGDDDVGDDDSGDDDVGDDDSGDDDVVPTEVCDDGEDNDLDGDADCDDSDCSGDAACPALCGPAGLGNFAINLTESDEAITSWPWELGSWPWADEFATIFYPHDYLSFFSAAEQQYGHPISPTELDARLYAIATDQVGRYPALEGDWDGDGVDDYPVATEALADVIVDGSNLRFLLDGLDQRDLLVQPADLSVGTFTTFEGPSYPGTQLVLGLTDPWVGTIQVVLLLPTDPGPHPVVIAHPGHFETAFDFRDLHDGASYPGRGHALAIISPRAYDGYTTEDLVTRSALLGGFSMMAIRIYELMLVHKLLRCRPDIDADRLGLIGHSGGSGVGNPMIRVGHDIIDAYVTDNRNDYFNWVGGALQDETDPALFPWSNVINDFTTATMPVFEVPYNFLNEYQDIANFFEQHLGN